MIQQVPLIQLLFASSYETLTLGFVLAIFDLIRLYISSFIFRGHQKKNETSMIISRTFSTFVKQHVTTFTPAQVNNLPQTFLTL